jgi:uncharacterized membrane protein HdeD (DUF308 family)
MENIIKKTISTLKHWWVFLLSGILLIALSLYVAFTPVESYVNLAGIFSFLVLVTGLLTIYFSIANRKLIDGWGWYLAGGIFETIVGIGLLYYPEISIIMLPLFIGFWLLFKSAQLIGNSLELKDYGIMDWGWVMLFGILLSIMSFFMILDPVFGFVNVVYLTSISLGIAGIANIVLSLKLKKIKAKTIDKVEDFKKEVKKSIKDLKKEVINSLSTLSEEETAQLNSTFEQYESEMSK